MTSEDVVASLKRWGGYAVQAAVYPGRGPADLLKLSTPSRVRVSPPDRRAGVCYHPATVRPVGRIHHAEV
jgi:hypothetical protein